ncbi:hypothetical protein GW933_03355 [Candidatus Falkowbacteria bacterium]|uniref:3-hydroxybutyryl-CoA dehydrogenase n=1 Tax=Candidatus Buchananbacteria bacterium CG10_big_fil_rev_8_21_14_0_10_33_19 TaxID=1974525 RepID=A0A2H0W4Q2_9BACT|nr:hypothetical protein [Candidatus Falkowbacteria bacterium]PIS06338.1 MAG: hypothetical protein COT80_02100 [Candidatus Buchananbacteria bacterium CG10_big_fil_rev_8_21_14_0_10_33_19]
MNINKVCIIGGGFMGAQIAFYLAMKGVKILLTDLSMQVLDQSMNIINSLSSKFEVSDLDIDIYPGVIANSDLRHNYQLFIDCTTEDKDLKVELFKGLIASGVSGILATNSSFMPVTMLETDSATDCRMCNMHFLPPVWERPLVEIGRGTKTSQETIDTVIEFCQSVHLVPIVLHRSNPGFVFGYMWEAIKESSLSLAERDISSPEDIDLAWRTATGMSAGPFQVMDMVGLDLVAHLLQMHGKPIPKILQEKVSVGKLGQKSGSGFYSY